MMKKAENKTKAKKHYMTCGEAGRLGGLKGGKSKSAKKLAAARSNGAKGGRPAGTGPKAKRKHTKKA